MTPSMFIEYLGTGILSISVSWFFFKARNGELRRLLISLFLFLGLHFIAVALTLFPHEAGLLNEENVNIIRSFTIIPIFIVAVLFANYLKRSK